MNADKKLTVLVIDDEVDVNNEIEQTILETGNYLTKKAFSAEEAYKIVKEQDVDIALLDIRMPDIWGIDALKEIKKLSPDIVVIMLTALGEAKYAWDAATFGAFDYITKPFDQTSLLFRLKKAEDFLSDENQLKEKWDIIDNLRELNHKNPYAATKIWDKLYEETNSAGLNHPLDLSLSKIKNIFENTK